MSGRYSIPSLGGILNAPKNGYNVVSTFSGCGGSSLGYVWAGFKVAWANEFIGVARDTYRANFPGALVNASDIRKVHGTDILREASIDSVDVLDGSPPCSSFSSAGIREKGWGKVKQYSSTKQRTDDLFFEYMRLVDEIRPRIFLAENVTGLTRGKSRGVLVLVAREAKRIGYKLSIKTLDAQWLGVPQVRKRVIILGTRNDLGTKATHPKPLSRRYSVLDACPWITRCGLHPTGWDTGPSIKAYAIGNEWHRTRIGLSSKKYFNLVRVDPRRPCPTITSKAADLTAAGVCHPYECRKFSVLELKRLCSFPDDFTLLGTYEEQAERLGRAVPPLMMRHIASCIQDALDKGGGDDK